MTVKLHLRDSGLGDVAGTTFEFKTNAGVAKTVVDNGAGDADARPGYYSVQMPKAVSYTAKATALPEEISFDDASKTVSYWNSPTLVDMGTLDLHIKPGLIITMRYQGAVITGQTIKVTGLNNFSKTVTDGGPSDKDFFGNQSPADGKVYIRVPSLSNYQMCAMTSPSWQWGGCQTAWALQWFVAYPVTYDYQKVWADIPKLP
jgi:hypothetical protein